MAHILIVDDIEAERSQIKKLLSKAGLEMAESPDQGVQPDQKDGVVSMDVVIKNVPISD